MGKRLFQCFCFTILLMGFFQSVQGQNNWKKFFQNNYPSIGVSPGNGVQYGDPNRKKRLASSHSNITVPTIELGGDTYYRALRWSGTSYNSLETGLVTSNGWKDDVGSVFHQTPISRCSWKASGKVDSNAPSYIQFEFDAQFNENNQTMVLNGDVHTIICTFFNVDFESLTFKELANALGSGCPLVSIARLNFSQI